MIKVLFVCLGNICRSPTAEAVFRYHTKQAGLKVMVDSAGTAGWHQGQPSDPRSCKTAADFGYDMSKIRSRAIIPSDFHTFNFVLAMDYQNLSDLEIIRNGQGTRPQLFLDFAHQLSEREIPDPYYGGKTGFVDVLHLIEQASAGLLAQLQA